MAVVVVVVEKVAVCSFDCRVHTTSCASSARDGLAAASIQRWVWISRDRTILRLQLRLGCPDASALLARRSLLPQPPPKQLLLCLRFLDGKEGGRRAPMNDLQLLSSEHEDSLPVSLLSPSSSSSSVDQEIDGKGMSCWAWIVAMKREFMLKGRCCAPQATEEASVTAAVLLVEDLLSLFVSFWRASVAGPDRKEVILAVCVAWHI